MWRIYDWAGNLKFRGKRFKSFQAGWAHIDRHAPKNADDAWYGEWYVLRDG